MAVHLLVDGICGGEMKNPTHNPCLQGPCSNPATDSSYPLRNVVQNQCRIHCPMLRNWTMKHLEEPPSKFGLLMADLLQGN
ncbi:hypothetical protein SDJN02_22223 [Cucurbita argyrosperma subsp. argyrosperma]|nr:hypothetical protein SDJN02_22223 [Cucurbita argyrosperma subsp. argyrosperma]